jgi:hypothetical protein
MTEKDIKAISKIINGILYGTRFFNPMVETIGRYLERKGMIQSKVYFKNLCVNGTKSNESNETPVVYHVQEKNPETRVYFDNNAGKANNQSFERVLEELTPAKSKMLNIISKSYGHKQKNKDNKR